MADRECAVCEQVLPDGYTDDHYEIINGSLVEYHESCCPVCEAINNGGGDE